MPLSLGTGEGALHKKTDDLVESVGSSLLTRRQLIQSLATVLAPAVLIKEARSVAAPQQSSATSATELPFNPALLPLGIRSRFVNKINGLRAQRPHNHRPLS